MEDQMSLFNLHQCERGYLEDDREYVTEAKLTCQWCGEEFPEDELVHGVCFDCLEEYYEPELAQQFIQESNLEADFYVSFYMDTYCETIDPRLVDACKEKFMKNLHFAKSQSVDFPTLYKFDEANVWELQCLREYVLSDELFEAWAQWAIDNESRKQNAQIIFAPAPAKAKV